MATEPPSILYGSLPMDDDFGGNANDDANVNVHVEPLTIHLTDDVTQVKPWEFPGWGSSISESADPAELKELDATLAASKQAHRLGEWPATAICGNDILSSCLYTTGIVAVRAGKLAPVAMATVAAILYLYRYIYTEVVTAIPLNGGSYNALLNTTTKRIASVAAALGILSYVATGVVSGTSACTYLQSVIPLLPVVEASVGLLLFFALLSIVGIRESAGLALVIFVVHTATLIVLCAMSIVFLVKNEATILRANLSADYPDVSVAGATLSGTVWTAFFFGMCTAMLGISGFETSAQFVEDQAPGVFPKTLRNMWWGVAAFNPMISLLSLAVLPLPVVVRHKDTVLSAMARVVGGPALETWMAIDAFVVLSGAVLTSYVGITGLVRRLALDRILPSMLLTTNSCRSTNHWIILAYFAIAASLVVTLHGQVETLSGVYTFAFLALMIMFGVGCMLLKFKRSDLLRQDKGGAPWSVVVVGVACMVLALGGNLVGDPTVLSIALVYFFIVLAVVAVMFERVFLLRLLLAFVTFVWPSKHKTALHGRHAEGSIALIRDRKFSGDDEGHVERDGASYVDDSVDNVPFQALSSPGLSIARAIHAINGPPILFFCKRPHLPTLNKAILYVRQNEETSHLYIVHVKAATSMMDAFAGVVGLFDRIYPKLKIDFVEVDTHGYLGFGPAVVDWVSRKYHTPKNLMFIKQPSHDCAHTIASLGGVRVITG
ncbi:hypothetical protein H310_03164 [Aphanomyces invadans]|uniref:Transmembrane protein n=1 Tax=Aphanomyces invadans TaxID=157072 RepID=A0A024ULB2_9STRA|nr:hypothetical protein H310_03164 [Aphanomyces invadans]ETW07094.1 hypothetical protein H310_03164 [Aphanomyces invadans]|eukprot:XP_008865169.1 hypothetical protein H310_03164 [Aphanomyces invadans]